MTLQDQPLQGLRVLTCRQDGRGHELDHHLTVLGAQVIGLPMVAVEPADTAGLAEALVQLGDYDWLVCTSANGVESLGTAELPVTAELKLAAVGSATSDAFGALTGRPADLVPAVSTAAGLVEAFPAGPGRVLAVLAELADEDLAEGLTAKNWDVRIVRSYRTTMPVHPEELVAMAKTAHVVVLTAPSVARRVVETLGGPLPSSAVVLGPKTAVEAERLGFDVTQVAPGDVALGVKDVWERRER